MFVFLQLWTQLFVSELYVYNGRVQAYVLMRITGFSWQEYNIDELLAIIGRQWEVHVSYFI